MVGGPRTVPLLYSQEEKKRVTAQAAWVTRQSGRVVAKTVAERKTREASELEPTSRGDAARQ